MSATARAAGIPHVSEASFQQAVIDLARRLRWLAYHTFDSRRSASGYPDLTLVRDGQLVFVELKSERGRVSPAQREWLEALAAVGQRVYVWRPSDWPEVERTLKARGAL